MGDQTVTFEHLKPDSIVVRLLAGEVPMTMRVIKVEDGVIHATVSRKHHPDFPTFPGEVPVWTFDSNTGAEIDDDLGWGPEYGITGSYLLGARDEP